MGLPSRLLGWPYFGQRLLGSKYVRYKAGDLVPDTITATALQLAQIKSGNLFVSICCSTFRRRAPYSATLIQYTLANHRHDSLNNLRRYVPQVTKTCIAFPSAKTLTLLKNVIQLKLINEFKMCILLKE